MQMGITPLGLKMNSSTLEGVVHPLLIVLKPFSNWGYPQLQVNPQLTYIGCECIPDSHVLQFMHTHTPQQHMHTDTNDKKR